MYGVAGAASDPFGMMQHGALQANGFARAGTKHPRNIRSLARLPL